MRAAAHYFATSAEKEEIGHILVRRPATAFAAGRHFTQKNTASFYAKKYRVILRKKMPRHFTQHVSLYGIARRPERAARDTQNGEQKNENPTYRRFYHLSGTIYRALWWGRQNSNL